MKTLAALVGTKFRGQAMLDLLASLPQGEPLELRRDPVNKHDPNAVEVWARGQHIGFVPRTQNRPIALAMDRAMERVPGGVKYAPIPARLAIDGGKQPLVEFEI